MRTIQPMGHMPERKPWRMEPAPAVTGIPKIAQPMRRARTREITADLIPLSFRTVRPRRKKIIGTAATSAESALEFSGS